MVLTDSDAGTSKSASIHVSDLAICCQTVNVGNIVTGSCALNVFNIQYTGRIAGIVLTP